MDPETWEMLRVIREDCMLTDREVLELEAILSATGPDGKPAYSKFVIQSSVDVWRDRGCGASKKHWRYFVGIVKRMAEEVRAANKSLSTYRFED